jgi:hypothetical protein
MSLQPMGGHTLYDEDGQEMGSACGEHNREARPHKTCGRKLRRSELMP